MLQNNQERHPRIRGPYPNLVDTYQCHLSLFRSLCVRHKFLYQQCESRICDCVVSRIIVETTVQCVSKAVFLRRLIVVNPQCRPPRGPGFSPQAQAPSRHSNRLASQCPEPEGGLTPSRAAHAHACIDMTGLACGVQGISSEKYLSALRSPSVLAMGRSNGPQLDQNAHRHGI